MIAEQYIKEGIRLRKVYLENIKEIIKQEPKIHERKKMFEVVKDEMKNLVFGDLNEIRKTVEINNKLLDLEKEIKIIQDIIRPYYETIEKLKGERDRLYVAIKEKYPDITFEQIEKEIMSRLGE